MQQDRKADQQPAHAESGGQEHCHPEAGCFRLVPLFSHLSNEEMQFLATGAQTRHFSKGEVVFQAGQDLGLLFVVARGRVKLTRVSASGREQVVRLLGPGDFYGELSLFLPQALAATGVALHSLEDAGLIRLEGRRSVRLLDMNGLAERAEGL